MFIYYLFKSQPCHWRNLKSVAKREIAAEKVPVNSTLSDNISLFQSLRVLQEDDENGFEKPQASISKSLPYIELKTYKKCVFF
jgi:hypothetical protein